MEESRRQFLADLLRGAGAVSLLTAAGCGNGSGFESGSRVDDRFHESMSGHGRPLVFPEAASDRFCFLWCSDLHVTESGNHALDRIGKCAEKAGAVMVFHSGDLVDQGRSGEYDRFEELLLQFVPVPFFSAIGNHDIQNGGWERFRPRVGPSVFRFGYGPCDFVFIDTANGTVGRDQLDWLERQLPQLTGRHRLVFGHYPMYQGAVQTPGSMGNTEERLALFQLFDRNGIDYYLSGHVHAGEAFEIVGTRHVITGAACPDKALSPTENHIYRFDVTADAITREKILVSDL